MFLGLERASPETSLRRKATRLVVASRGKLSLFHFLFFFEPPQRGLCFFFSQTLYTVDIFF